MGSGFLRAATFTWNGSSSTDWFTATNWIPNGVPGSTDTVNIASGPVNFSAPVVFNGQFNWSGGNLQGNPLTLGTNAVLTVSGNNNLVILNIITNGGTFVLGGSGNVILDSGSGGGQMINLPTGLINFTGFVWIESNNKGGELVVNQGTIRDSFSGNTEKIFPPCNNSGGTVSAVQGTLQFLGGGSIDGTYNASSGTTINLNAGAFSSATVAAMNGPGTIQFTGGTLSLSSNVNQTLALNGGTVTLGPGFQGGSITNLTLAGSSLTATSAVSGVLNWGGGTLSGALTVQTNGSLNISSNAGKILYASLTNAGTVTWTGNGNLEVDFNGALGEFGLIQNLATGLFDMQNSQTINSAATNGAIFQNAGTFRKSVSSGTSTISIPIVNSGNVSAQIGTITFGGGGTVDGTFSAVSGSTVNFNAGGFTSAVGATVNGPGIIQLNGGTLALLNNVSTNLTLAAGTVTVGPAFQGGSITNLTLAGSALGGTSSVTGTLNFNGGTIAGPLTVQTNGTLNIAGSNTKFVWAALTNAGTVVFGGSGNLEVDYSSSVNEFGLIVNLATGLFDIQNSQTILNTSPNGAFFQNAGTLRKSVNGGTGIISIPFLNTGSVVVQAGTLQFNGGGTINGTFSVASSTFLKFNSGNFTYSTPPTISGAGTAQFTGGTLTLATDMIPNLQLAGGTLNLGAGFQGGVITNLTMIGGTLSGTNFTVSGTFNWAVGSSRVDLQACKLEYSIVSPK